VRVSQGGVKMETDWNMGWVAVAVVVPGLMFASNSFLFEYTGAQFHWRSEQIGYYLTVTGVAMMFHLTVLLPLATKLFKPSSLSTPALSAATHPPSPQERDRLARILLSFDLRVARVSLFLGLLGHIIMTLASTPEVFFFGGIVWGLFSGFPAAMQSAALEVYRRSGGKETGKLFGALSVMQSFGAEIIGPSLFGSIYTATVSSYPQAIFAVGAAVEVLSILVTIPIRVRPMSIDAESDTDVDVDRPEFEEGSSGSA